MTGEYKTLVDSDRGLQNFIEAMDRKWDRKYRNYKLWGGASAKK
jgi:hypothetical protein